MKRVISLLLALTVALSLAACGGASSSSAASSEAASESASESASSEPEATAAPTETPAPAASNYFAQNGIEVQPTLPDWLKGYYCTWQKDNPDVYTQWDNAEVTFNQTVEPSDEREGYKKVTLETHFVASLNYTDPSLQGEWRISWSSGIYDLYTGRQLPAGVPMVRTDSTTKLR